jgi:hypothetical protein
MSEGIVQVVHCIDTEGPLFEPLSATFERLSYIFGIDLEPTKENLERLQRGDLDLGGKEDAVRIMVAPEVLAYNDSWGKIGIMLDDIMSDGFRQRYADSFGDGWVFNWHCVDHVEYESNPRRRDIGYHKVFDFYQNKINETGSDRDGIHFHYHPMPFSGQANHCATHWFAHSDTLFQVIAHRLIDLLWFPSVNRPGFHTTRPDSHWFLEQFIPFDYANQAYQEEDDQPDLGNGRFGDWRRAPRNWHPYHPSHDDYQIPGESRRSVFRCLNVGTRARLLRQEDVDQAFVEARDGNRVVLAFANHDYRDMRPDIKTVYDMLISAQERHKDIKFCHAEGREAARYALGLGKTAPCRLSLEIKDAIVYIESDKPIFGPQPFLALKTHKGEYRHDNLDIHEPFKRWSYVLDEHTIPMNSLEAVGVGACDDTGNVSVAVWHVDNERLETHYL